MRLLAQAKAALTPLAIFYYCSVWSHCLAPTSMLLIIVVNVREYYVTTQLVTGLHRFKYFSSLAPIVGQHFTTNKNNNNILVVWDNLNISFCLSSLQCIRYRDLAFVFVVLLISHLFAFFFCKAFYLRKFVASFIVAKFTIIFLLL